ncbi:hypothetical protein OSTOST_03929 [Ostertagia ostertagi]
MKSGIADVLFQGDMLLSEEQRDQIFTDNSGSRSKRQAYNDETYPGRRWPHTIYYSLEKPLHEKTKKSFVTAAELWMNNTCINFKNDENETADDLIIVFEGQDVGQMLVESTSGSSSHSAMAVKRYRSRKVSV